MVRLVSFLPQFWHYTNMMGYSALHNVVFLYQGNWFYQFEIFKLNSHHNSQTHKGFKTQSQNPHNKTHNKSKHKV